MDTLESLISVLQEAVKTKQRNAVLQRELEHLQNKVDKNTLLKQVEKLEERNKILETGIEDARIKKGGEKHRADCLEHANERLKTENDRLKNLNEDFILENQTLRMKIAQQAKALERIGEENEELKNANEAAKRKLDKYLK